MQRGGQPVHAKPMQVINTDFEYICTIPTSGNILLCLRSCYHPLFHTIIQMKLISIVRLPIIHSLQTSGWDN